MVRRLVLVCGLSFDDHRDNAILIADDVHIALCVLTDANSLARKPSEAECFATHLGTRIRTLATPHIRPGAEIGVEEYPLHTRHLGSTIDNTAQQLRTLRIVIFGYRLCKASARKA